MHLLLVLVDNLKAFKLNLAYHHAFAEYGVDALMVGVGYAF